MVVKDIPSQKVGHTLVYNRPEYDRKLRSGVNLVSVDARCAHGSNPWPCVVARLLLGGGGPNSRNQQLNVVIVHPSPRLKPVNQFYTVYNCHAKQSFVRKQLTRGTLN